MQETTTLAVTIDDIREAADRIADDVVRTPTAFSSTLSEITGAEVFVKFENLQFTASYKERGALNRLAQLPGDTAGIVAASAGNFAQGIAHHGTRLGLPTVIVMPSTTPSIKVSRTRHLGAEIVSFGETFDDARSHAATLAGERGFELVSPFDDPAVIAGQGTIALELLHDVPDLDVIVTPIGGGGLQAGIAVAARAIDPRVQLIGVQSERFPAVYNLLTGSDLPVGGSTIAEGIAVSEPGRRTVAIIRALVDHVEVVEESLLEEAIGLYLEIEKTVAEGAGAAPLAELLARPDRYRGRRVGLVLTGGNIDLRQLASVTLRCLVRSGRLSTFWVELDDRPGSLGAITMAVGDLGGNIVEVIHRRLDVKLHARSSEVELTVETSDRRHATTVLDGLAQRGFRVRGPETHRHPG